MTKQIFIGLFTEGPTDERFLQSIVRKAFDEVAFEAIGDFEFYIQPIQIQKRGLGFTDQVLTAAREGAEKYGITILCLHKDADHANDHHVFEDVIEPAVEALQQTDQIYCKTVVVIVPVQMIEAWLLADKSLFKQALGTDKSDQELGIVNHPESINNPKEVIKNAIKIAHQHRTRRRRSSLSISEIYMPLGEEISIAKLSLLPSFNKFRNSVRKAFISLNYLQK